MTPVAAMLLWLGVALFSLLALLGERRFAGQERLPVHWGAGGRADLFAPRRLSLAIFPLVGLTLTLLLALARRPDFVVALALLAAAAGYLVYFRAIVRTVDAA